MSAFPVDIDANENVGDQKEAIKAECRELQGPARNLQLFLAKKDGAWLKCDDPAALELE